MYIYITLQLLIKVDYPSIMTEIFYLYFIFPIFFLPEKESRIFSPPYFSDPKLYIFCKVDWMLLDLP